MAYETFAEALARLAVENLSAEAQLERTLLARKLSWLKKHLYQARYRAPLRNLEYSITVSDILEIPDFCPILKTPLDYTSPSSPESTPSLDRCNPHLGYVAGNVWIISWKANQMKGHKTFYEFVEWMVAKGRLVWTEENAAISPRDVVLQLSDAETASLIADLNAELK